MASHLTVDTTQQWAPDGEDAPPSPSVMVGQDMLERQLKEREEEFTDNRTLHFFFGTWNVNAKGPTDDLTSWLVEKDPWPDVYVIGFQEIVDLNAVNLLADHDASRPWEAKIISTISTHYKLIRSQHLVGLSMGVYAKKELAEHISLVEDATVGVGIMGVGGNKGGVAVRMNVFDSTFCFVNTHLAAHKNAVPQRNGDFHKIYNKMSFNVNGRPWKISDHDHVFWIGDLNYRLNLQDLHEARQKFHMKDFTFMLAHDQLIEQRKQGNAFAEFQEGEIAFPPTYKYIPGTQTLDERPPPKKQRFPAWCDRIQWRGEKTTQMYYTSTEDQICSDHKPVKAFFAVETKKYNAAKRETVRAEIMRQNDEMMNNARAKIQLSANPIHFGEVVYDKPKTMKVEITNVGIGMFQWMFKPKPGETAVCKPWLTIEPRFGMLRQGETKEVLLTINVTRETARELNTGAVPLEDILLLKRGRDQAADFLVVKGDYVKSSFGSSLEFLVNMRQPVRFATGPPPQGGTASPLTIPKELWRMVDFIYPDGLHQEGLFGGSSNPRQIERIREALDTGQEFGDFDVASMAEAMVHFLESLADPVFPASLAEQYDPSTNLTAWCKQALAHSLTEAQYNTFVYVIAFLRECLRNKDANGTSLDHLSYLFAKALCHVGDKDIATAGANLQAIVVIKHFLSSPDFAN